MTFYEILESGKILHDIFKMAMTQGRKANQAGQILEVTLEGTLQGHKYYKISPSVSKHQQQEYILNYSVLPKVYARNEKQKIKLKSVLEVSPNLAKMR